MVNVSWGSDISPVSRFRLLVASAVLGAVVAVGAIAFLAACEVVTRLALTQCAGYQPGGPAGETVLVPSAVGGSPRVWLLVPIAMLGRAHASKSTQIMGGNLIWSRDSP